jgi:hypothetical protein
LTDCFADHLSRPGIDGGTPGAMHNVHPLPVKKSQKKNKVARLNIEPWHDRLIVSDSGKIEGVLGNAMIALREAPAWQFVVAYDEFAQKIMLRSSQNESTAFPEAAGGNLVTKPFPNVFEEPLKNLQT